MPVEIETITTDAVQKALAEHNELGLAAFCDRYGFDRARSYVIVADGLRYGTRVIAAAAHGQVPGQVPLRPDEVATDEVVNQKLEELGFEVRQLGPPTWTREELVLACSLLFKNDRVALRAHHQRVKDLAALLQQLPIHAVEDRGHNFRSTNSVQRKLFDLMTRLPGYTKKKTRGGQLDEQIVLEFLADEERMHEQADAIRTKYAPSPEPVPVRAWSLFSAEGERKYGGNTGYDDVLGVQYVYDNNVGNFKQLRVGDVIVIRDGEDVRGVGRIGRIKEQAEVPKLQRTCPKCGGGRFDERKVQRPRYRCRRADCHFEFEEPADRHTLVTQFVAFYGDSWRALDGAIDVEELKSACLDDAVQNAIRPLDFAKLEAMLARVSVQPPEEQPKNAAITAIKAARLALIGHDGAAAPRGGRREATTKVRNGQGAFRKELLKRYGFVCAITGPCPAEVLQAAHLKDFAEHETHNLDEGVLLRADVHLLFDNDLLAVNPATWKVVVAPSLSIYPTYAQLDGADFISGPSPDAVREHFLAVTATWINGIYVGRHRAD